MPQLSSSDCEKLLALTGELYTVEDAGSLPQSILRSLRTIIPHEFGGCHLIEPSRHFIAGGANFAFADGHSEFRRWVNASTMPPARPDAAGLPMLPDERADFRWVLSITSVVKASKPSPYASGY